MEEVAIRLGILLDAGRLCSSVSGAIPSDHEKYRMPFDGAKPEGQREISDKVKATVEGVKRTVFLIHNL